MKKIGMLALALVTVMGVNAQKGVEDGSRYGHGADSINTLKNISIYSEYYKTNNFKDAYEQGWKEVFRDAPLASVNTYNYGIKKYLGYAPHTLLNRLSGTTCTVYHY